MGGGAQGRQDQFRGLTAPRANPAPSGLQPGENVADFVRRGAQQQTFQSDAPQWMQRGVGRAGINPGYVNPEWGPTQQPSAQEMSALSQAAQARPMAGRKLRRFTQNRIDPTMQAQFQSLPRKEQRRYMKKLKKMTPKNAGRQARRAARQAYGGGLVRRGFAAGGGAFYDPLQQQNSGYPSSPTSNTFGASQQPQMPQSPSWVNQPQSSFGTFGTPQSPSWVNQPQSFQSSFGTFGTPQAPYQSSFGTFGTPQAPAQPTAWEMLGGPSLQAGSSIPAGDANVDGFIRIGSHLQGELNRLNGLDQLRPQQEAPRPGAGNVADFIRRGQQPQAPVNVADFIRRGQQPQQPMRGGGLVRRGFADGGSIYNTAAFQNQQNPGYPASTNTFGAGNAMMGGGFFGGGGGFNTSYAPPGAAPLNYGSPERPIMQPQWNQGGVAGPSYIHPEVQSILNTPGNKYPLQGSQNVWGTSEPLPGFYGQSVADTLRMSHAPGVAPLEQARYQDRLEGYGLARPQQLPGRPYTGGLLPGENVTDFITRGQHPGPVNVKEFIQGAAMPGPGQP